MTGLAFQSEFHEIELPLRKRFANCGLCSMSLAGSLRREKLEWLEGNLIGTELRDQTNGSHHLQGSY